MKAIILRLVAIYLFFASATLLAETILLDSETKIPINDKVIKIENKVKIKNDSRQEVLYGFDYPKGLCQFELQNRDSRNTYIVRIPQSKVDFVQLFVQHQNGKIDTLPLLNKIVGIRQRPIKSVDFCFTISLQKDEKVTCLLASGRKYGVHAPIISIASEAKFAMQEIYFSQYTAFIFGICIVISLAVFFYIFFLDEKCTLLIAFIV